MKVLAGRPKNNRDRGIHVLQLMKGMSPNFHESLVELWDTVIPKLTQYLEGMSQNSEKTLKIHIPHFLEDIFKGCTRRF